MGLSDPQSILITAPLKYIGEWQESRKGWTGGTSLLVRTGHHFESARAVEIGNVMLGLDPGPGCAFEHVANAELQFCLLRVADGHNEATLSFIRLALQEQVESEVVVRSIVHLITPYPCAALDRFDFALPVDTGGGLL